MPPASFVESTGALPTNHQMRTCEETRRRESVLWRKRYDQHLAFKVPPSWQALKLGWQGKALVLCPRQ
ncbi:uncharacterized protein ColSpa_00343 [Colletotrichum spaethianum]|uniref:Uncharacterized protein n=1 Tax=Colletotrichum spaethianum TaxID=700344 RepID=A0AA37NSW0_9PEZI|nr:uncharacterized protein ColSpa_00343 [Colletotrichum spaethianum]GKT40162.1 hypothetical protein ColSpa_00343 [Colletotrichum spaethianum]